LIYPHEDGLNNKLSLQVRKYLSSAILFLIEE